MAEKNPNPYKDKDGNPRLLKSITAFIDILGYSEYIKKCFKDGNGQEELKRLRDALDSAYADLKQKAGRDEWASGANLQIRTFTDNLVIGYPVSDPKYNEDEFAQDKLQSVIFYVSFLQAELARCGYLIRGAITIGELYIDDDIVFGSSLIEAVESEKKAVFPRVIICPEAKKCFRASWNDKGISDLLVDSDNMVFIDYLEATVMIAYPDDRPFTEFLDGNKACIENNLKRFHDAPYIRAKYEWAAVYHNSFCEKYPDLFDDSNKIALKDFVPLPKPWILKAM
jgi:hypothetical protein